MIQALRNLHGLLKRNSFSISKTENRLINGQKYQKFSKDAQTIPSRIIGTL